MDKKKFSLKRTNQCAKCPWKVDVDPYDIPDGYCEVKHKNLESTIAKKAEYNPQSTLSVMACHHSTPEEEEYCIGWLNNQLGVGNNIMLRLKMMSCDNANKIKVFGEQHQNFEDTLPKK